MKYLTKTMLSLMLLAAVLTTGVYAHGEESHAGLDLDQVVQDIMTSQNVSSVEEIDCEGITDAQFELLGDAVMEEMHPGDAHVQMDQMMGGEGSESLEISHIRMGQAYLNCFSSTAEGNTEIDDMPMMQNSATSLGGGMMSGIASTYSALGLLTWIALIVFLVSGSVYFLKKNT